LIFASIVKIFAKIRLKILKIAAVCVCYMHLIGSGKQEVLL